MPGSIAAKKNKIGHPPPSLLDGVGSPDSTPDEVFWTFRQLLEAAAAGQNTKFHPDVSPDPRRVKTGLLTIFAVFLTRAGCLRLELGSLQKAKTRFFSFPGPGTKIEVSRFWSTAVRRQKNSINTTICRICVAGESPVLVPRRAGLMFVHFAACGCVLQISAARVVFSFCQNYD